MLFWFQCWLLAIRLLRSLWRQPWFIALTLAQPVIWLGLYGQLFRRVNELPGFPSGKYIDFLTPGVVVMSALFSAGWSGMGILTDLDRGIIDRFLVLPISRITIVLGRLLNIGFMSAVQSAILLLVGLLLGARYSGGMIGFLGALAAALLLATSISASSMALALLIRKQESVIGIVNFLLLPLTFLSPVFMAGDLMPGWMRAISQLNPVSWSVEAARSILLTANGFTPAAFDFVLLLGLNLACTYLAVWTFRAYQKSI